MESDNSSNSGKMIPWPGNWRSAPFLFVVNMQKAWNDLVGMWKGNFMEIYPFVATLSMLCYIQ